MNQTAKAVKCGSAPLPCQFDPFQCCARRIMRNSARTTLQAVAFIHLVYRSSG